MTRLEIKSLHSSDVELFAWLPDSNSVWFPLQLEIGEAGDARSDVFDMMVATPEGMLEKATPDARGVLSKRGLLVLRTFSWDTLRHTLDSIVRDCQAETWETSVLRLQRYFYWEYEDYSKEPEVN